MTKSFKKRLNKERKDFEKTYGINGESSKAETKNIKNETVKTKGKTQESSKSPRSGAK